MMTSCMLPSSYALVLVFVVFALVFIPAVVLVHFDFESTNIYENDWKNSIELTKNETFRLSWIPLDHRIVFLVEAKTRGYFGIGFSWDGRMAKADIAIGWVNDLTKKPYLIDCHGDEINTMPIKDPIQNYELLNGHQNNTHTVLMFTRLWNTCDESDDFMIGNGTSRLIWALGGDDPIDETLFSIMWHGEERGSRSINLRNPPMKNFQKNVKHIDFTLPEVNIPQNQATVYWCKIFKLLPLHVKHHIVGYTPVLQEANSDLIHHMLLYECNEIPSSLSRMSQYSSENGFQCYSSKMPFEAESCITPIIAWAVGSEGEFFPKHIGLPFGENPKQERYYMLEIHYNNPSLREVVDSSGVRLSYTDHLRKYDGGIFTTGILVSPLHIIPPFQEAYKTAGYCDRYCTNSVFPLNGVNSVSVVLHAHSAARKMKLRHFRQGEELPPIVQDDHYDFNYQQPRELLREVTIFPGDELVTECTYNTVNRTQPTQGGFSTKQEMCLAYITYYPKVSLAACQSMNPIKFFFFTFGIKKFYQYDMETVEKMFLKLTGKGTEKPSKKTTILPKFPFSTPDNAFDKKVNEAYILALKQMKDYTIEEPVENNLFQDLVISEPTEFQNKTFSQHLFDLPWKEIYQSLEKMLYHGEHMTFCRLENDSLALPATIHWFPNISEYKVPNENDVLKCKRYETNGSCRYTKNLIFVLLFLILLKI